MPQVDPTTAMELGASRVRAETNAATRSEASALAVIARAFSLIGWVAFGGPAAHVGLFSKVFVRDDASAPNTGATADASMKWLSRGTFAEFLALGQCLPGPTSTQMSFAIGVARGGTLGGLTSGILFQYPGLVLMSLAGAGAAEALTRPGVVARAFTAGLSAGGASLIFSAADSLARSQGGKTRTTRLLCAFSAACATYASRAWLFPSLIAFGGTATYVEAARAAAAAKKTNARDGDANSDARDDDAEEVTRLGLSPLAGGFMILAWASALVGLGVYVSKTTYETNKELHWFEAFYRTGSIIFGGGQVVLPLLLNDVVQYDTTCSARDAVTDACAAWTKTERATSWVTEEQFFAGLALAQAAPGPLFNLSAYLGAVAARRAGVNVLVGIACAWFGLFGPGVILIFAVMPFWGRFRKWDVYKRALPGLNASAVGLVVAAAFNIAFKVRALSPFPNATTSIALICAFCAHIIKLPPGWWTLLQAPLVIVLGGLLGLFAHATDMN